MAVSPCVFLAFSCTADKCGKALSITNLRDDSGGLQFLSQFR